MAVDNNRKHNDNKGRKPAEPKKAFGLVVTPLLIEAGKLKWEVQLIELSTGQPVPDKVLVFTMNGNPQSNGSKKTDGNGKVTFDFTNIPKGSEGALFKVEAMVEGKPFYEYLQEFPKAKPGPHGAKKPKVVIESTKLHDSYRVGFGVFDPDEKGIKGRLFLSAAEDLEVVAPKTDADGKVIYDAAGNATELPAKIVSFGWEPVLVPESGWTFRELKVFKQIVEVDVFLEYWEVKTQLKLLGNEQAIKHELHSGGKWYNSFFEGWQGESQPWDRIMFAFFCLYLLTVSMLAPYFEWESFGWALLVLPVLFLLLLAKILNPFLKTNNKWFKTLGFVTVIAVVLVITADRGSSIMPDWKKWVPSVSLGQKSEYDLNKEKEANFEKYKEYLDDEQLQKKWKEEGKIKEPPQPAVQTPVAHRSWQPKLIRLIIALWLFIMWAIYGLFFAYMDEIADWIVSMKEKSGGESGGESWWQQFLHKVPHRQTLVPLVTTGAAAGHAHDKGHHADHASEEAHVSPAELARSAWTTRMWDIITDVAVEWFFHRKGQGGGH